MPRGDTCVQQVRTQVASSLFAVCSRGGPSSRVAWTTRGSCCQLLVEQRPQQRSGQSTRSTRNTRSAHSTAGQPGSSGPTTASRSGLGLLKATTNLTPRRLKERSVQCPVDKENVPGVCCDAAAVAASTWLAWLLHRLSMFTPLCTHMQRHPLQLLLLEPARAPLAAAFSRTAAGLMRRRR